MSTSTSRENVFSEPNDMTAQKNSLMKRLAELQIKFPRVAYTYIGRPSMSRARESSRRVCFGYENLILKIAVDRQVKAGHVRRDLWRMDRSADPRGKKMIRAKGTVRM